MSDHKRPDTAPVTAELRNWRECTCCWARQGLHYHGEIYNDAKGRFIDGELVTTSLVKSDPDETGVVQTKFSSYRLAPKGEPENWKVKHDVVRQELIDTLNGVLAVYGVEGAAKVTGWAMDARRARGASQ